MKKIILISVITVFEFINVSAYVSPQDCNWPNGNSHRADWNEDFGGWGEYWQWLPDEDVNVRNYYVVGCNVFKSIYFFRNFYEYPENTGFPQLGDNNHRKDFTGNLYNHKPILYLTISQLEGSGGDLGYLNSNQYPWHVPNIPVRTPYDGDIYARFLVTEFEDGTKTNTITGTMVTWYTNAKTYDFFLEEEKDNDSWVMVARFENGITTIPHECFAYNKHFIQVRKFPSSIHTIKEEAFMYSGLKEVKIGSGVNRIEHRAFAYIDFDLAVSMAANPPYCDPEVFLGTNISNKTLTVPVGSIGKYRSHSTFGHFGSIQDTNGSLYDAPESVTLNKPVLFLNIGDSEKLIATPASSTSSWLQPPVWKSSNEDIASVTQDGTVTLHKRGRAIITATSGDKSATCKVEYQDIKVDGTIEGICGDDIAYTFKDSVLTLTGTGSTWDYNVVYQGNFDDIADLFEQTVLWVKSIVTTSPFETFDSLIAKVVVGEGITNLGNFITSCLYNVTSFELPTTLKAVGMFTLGGSKIKSITLPDNMIYLGQNAFMSCYLLERITLPKTIDNLQYQEFGWCLSLKEVQILNPIPPGWHTVDVFNPDLEKNIVVVVPKNTRQDFLDANNGINSAENIFVWQRFKAVTEPVEDAELVDVKTGQIIPWDSIIPIKFTGASDVQVQLNLIPPNTYYDKVVFTSSDPSVVKVFQIVGEAENTAWLQTEDDVADTVTITATIQPYGTQYKFKARSYAVVSKASAIEVFTGDYQHILSPEFAPGTLEYTVVLEPEHESVTINPIPQHPRATASTLIRDIDYGTTEHEVTVQAEHWDYKTTYKITVTRPKPNTVALQTLATNPIQYKFDVPYGELNQDIFVEYDIDSIEVVPELGSEAETINHAIHPLKLGENIVRIPVIRPDNTVRWEYVIKITRLKDNDATLKSITIDTFTLTPPFSPTTFKYYLTAPNEVKRITVKTEGNGYVSYISGTGSILLNVGLQQAPVTVHAMDGTKRIYRINITRAGMEQPESSATGLEKVRNEHDVYREGSTLWIDTPASERIIIYSINGTKLYGMEKPAGKAFFVISRPDRILVVKGSSGWVRKVII